MQSRSSTKGIETEIEHGAHPFHTKTGRAFMLYDNVHDMAEYLDLDDIITCSKASRAWWRFFNEDLLWKRQLEKDFGIDSDMFASLCAYKQPAQMTAKNTYAWLSQITACPYRMPKYVKHLVKYELKGHRLVAIATDNAKALLNLITPDEQAQWYELALYAGCQHIPQQLFTIQTQGVIKADYLSKAILAGHEKMYDYITTRNRASLAPSPCHCLPAITSGSADILRDIKAKCPEGFSPSPNELYAAVASGSLAQVKLLTSDEFGNDIDTADDKALDIACEAGAIEITQFLQQQGVKPNTLTLGHAVTGGRRMLSYWLNQTEYGDLAILTHLAMSGAHKKLKHMLDARKDIISIDKVTLIGIAGSGEYESLRLILSSDKVKLQSKPNKQILNTAAQSGCVKSVKHLTEVCNLTPGNSTLSAAATSGNLALIQYLMHEHGLIPDLNTLRHGILAESFAITDFLLDPSNDFYDLTWLEVLVNCHLEEGRLDGNSALATCLLACHRFIRHAIHDLAQQGEHIDIQGFLDNAYEMAPAHFSKMLRHIISQPERYHLSGEDVEWLKELGVVKTALAPEDNYLSNLKSLGL